MLEQADILLLDEPTNHLDRDTIEWLIQFIHRHVMLSADGPITLKAINKIIESLNTIGAGITIGCIWIPEPFVSKVLATVGAVISMSPGGVVFNSSPHLAQLVPGNLGSGLNFWGFSFQ